jgi:AcrR family transcriptional regulator
MTSPKPDARDRIQEAAHLLFAERGPDEVTMSEVARAAGVARATVFNHFGSKRALLESMAEGVLDLYHGLLEQGLAESDRSTPSTIRHLFVVMGYGIENERRFHRAVFREITKISLGLEEDGPGVEARRRNHVALAKLLARGQARGEISKDQTPDALASAFASLVAGTITHWLYDDDSHPLLERMRDAADIFLSPVASYETQPLLETAGPRIKPA